MKPCFDYSLNHISRYPKTEHTLRQFLLRKWYSLEEINEAMNRLKKLWMINDALYTELYLESEVWRQWKPLFLIQQKLYQKWIDRDLVSSVIIEIEEWLYNWMRKKIYSEFERLSVRDYAEQTIIKKLVQKGYPYSLVMETCSIE